MNRRLSHHTWHEVAVRFRADQIGSEEFIREIFLRLGYDQASYTVVVETIYGYGKVYCRTAGEAARLSRRILSLGIKKIKVFVTALSPAHWRDVWKKEIHPFQLTRRFDVVPCWNRESYQPGTRCPIYLDTILSFGTGLHETTRFMAELIEQCAGRFRTFLDIGTGTGLLAIIAARCGADTVWGIDIDEQSVVNAQQNMQRNGLAFDWCAAMDARSFSSRRKFDFTAANVITDELIAMKAKLIATVKPGKYLAVSGIALDSLRRFQTAFRDDRLRCRKIIKGRKWCALLYQKRVRTSTGRISHTSSKQAARQS